MSDKTPVYGYSRGYLSLTVISFTAAVVSLSIALRSEPPSIVALAGTIGFFALFIYSWSKGRRRHVLLNICTDGFEFVDPAIAAGLVTWEEISEVRIYATLERPIVAFSLHDPRAIGRRLPYLNRYVTGILWGMHHHQFSIQLDNLDDQVGAISSVATKHGVVVVSELV